MSILKSWGKILVRPYTQTFSDVKGSMGRIREMGQEYKKARQDRRDQQKLLSEIANTDKDRFEFLVSQNEWSEQELINQALAAKRTRRAVLYLTGFLILALFAILLFASLWASYFFGLVLIGLSASTAGAAIKYAWFESQLQERSLHSMRSFLSREDFFTRIFN
jgi:hypothetical protein